MGRLRVVAGILRDARGRVLIAERCGDDAMAGKWEFPGGKIEAGETATAALARELAEELDIEVQACARFMRLQHDYADRQVEVSFYLVSEWLRDPRGCDGQRLQWVQPSSLDAESMLAADAPVLEALAELRAGAAR